MTNPTANRSKLSQFTISLFITIFAFCLTLALLELTLRLIGLGDPVLYRTHSAYRYALLPDQQKERILGAKVTIDSHGLRTVQDWADSDSLKILFLGDSVTWGGTAVDDKRTFAYLAGQKLQQRLARPVVTGNAGVNGYGTDNMTARLQYEHFGENVLVIVLIAGDTIRGLADIRGSYFFTRKPPSPLPAIWEFTAFALSSISSQMQSIPPIIDSDSNAVATDSLNRLFDVLRSKQSHGIPVLLVLSPYADELGHVESRLTKQVRHTLSNSGLALLDLYPFISSVPAKSPYSDGVHLNEYGHSLYARLIATKLIELIQQHTEPITKKPGY